jgi:hypothetical protein
MKEKYPDPIPQMLDVRDLRARHDQKQKALGLETYIGITITEGLNAVALPDGSIALTNKLRPQPTAEMVIVLTKDNPPTTQLLSSLKGSIYNASDRTRMIGYGITASDWNDYNLQAFIDSLVFLDFPEFFPKKNLVPKNGGVINVIEGSYAIDYYRDTLKRGLEAEPNRLVFGVIHKIAAL